MKRRVMTFAALALAGMAAGAVPQGERRMMWMLVGWTGVENGWVGEGMEHDWDREIGGTRKRYFDTIVPMDYRLTLAKFKSTLDEQEPFIADVKDRCIPGIGIRCGFGDIDPETAATQIREVRSRGYKGFAVFAYTAYTMDVLRQLKKEGLL